MNLPASLSVEAATWLRLQMTMVSVQASEPLREEIDKVDEWANGLFTVLVQLLPGLLGANPLLAQQLEPQWRRAAERFDQLAAGSPPAEPAETMDRLEAPKMLYRILEAMGVWAECRGLSNSPSSRKTTSRQRRRQG